MVNIQRSGRVFIWSFVWFFLLFYVIFGQEAFSFNFFSARTTRKNQIVGEWWTAGNAGERVGVSEDAVALWTTLANVKIGRWQRYGDSLLQKSLQQLSKAETLLTVDITEMLEGVKEENRRSTLTAYERNLQAMIEEMSISYEWLTSIAAERSSSAAECLVQKQEGDERFFGGIQEYNALDSQAWLEQSMKAGPCYISNRIEANAHDYLGQTIALSAQLVARRLQILEDNGDAIITYYPLLQDNTLQQLQEVQYNLNLVSTTSFQNVWSFFRRWVPANTDMPQFIDVRFRWREVPTYLQGWFVGQ